MIKWFFDEKVLFVNKIVIKSIFTVKNKKIYDKIVF